MYTTYRVAAAFIIQTVACSHLQRWCQLESIHVNDIFAHWSDCTLLANLKPRQGWTSKNSKKLRTQIYMDLRYIDPRARVLNYFYK